MPRTARALPYWAAVSFSLRPFITPHSGKEDMLKIRKGFTLIELLIVVVIIGILAAIAIPKFANTKSKAYITAMKSDLRNLVTAEEAYFSDSSAYLNLSSPSDTTTNPDFHFNNSTGVSWPKAVAGGGYWSATVTHSALPGTSCGISMNTSNPVDAAAPEGDPVCK